MPKCKVCKKEYARQSDSQVVCSYACSLEYSKQLISKREATRKKNARIALREYKNSDKPILLQLAQKLVNQFIRMRDDGLRCISCECDFTETNRVKNAGHYIAVSRSSLLRFNENNINLQCSYCNDQLASNAAEYRKKLIKKIGIKEVEHLEANKTALKTWTVEELQEIITKYRIKIKQYQEESK